MSTKHDLRDTIGHVMMVGLEGTTITPLERAWLKLIRPSGIILFRRNIESARQVIELLREATSIIGRPLLRAVDMEGGAVDRLRDLLGPMPAPAEVYGTHNPDLFFRHGQLIGKACHLTGFNVTFAPVLDLALLESIPVMKSRVVSARPTDVVHYASAFLAGLAEQEVFGCGKHFPGIGGGTLDSHISTPVIERSWAQMWKEDLVPYRDLAHALPMVMISHAAYPAVTKRSVPASISQHWIGHVLRKRIGYRGLVISDDMEMGGILTQCEIGEAAVLTIAAGMDMIEICRDPALILGAYEALLHKAETEGDFRRTLKAAARRVQDWSDRYVLAQTQTLRTPSAPRIERIKAEITKFRELCT